MNKNTRQTKPLGRSTKEDNAGLSLLQPTLFSYEGQVIKYYNEFTQTLSKSSSNFIAHLISKKFDVLSIFHCSWHDRYFRRELNDLIDLRFRAA